MKSQSAASEWTLNAMPCEHWVFLTVMEETLKKTELFDNLKSVNDILMIWRSRRLSLTTIPQQCQENVFKLLGNSEAPWQP